MKLRSILVLALTLACSPALAQVNQGTSPLSIAKGGTAANTASGARSSLGLGSMATQNAGAVAITGGTITGLPTPSSSSDAATKSYADGLASGLTILAPSRLATAAVLPNTPTYNNGASGVGATLTAGGNSTLTVDGTVANLNDVVLVNNQASAFQNGIYTVTTAGSGSAAWVLTRATYFNQTSNMLKGDYTFISAGSANINSAWVLSANVATVGTTAVAFNQFSNVGVSNIGGLTGAVTCGLGLNCSGGAISINPQSSTRQSILSGAVNTVGAPAFAGPGSGLNVNLTATATPLTMAFAAGFNSATGAVDYIGQEAADASSFWATLPASQYSFLSIDRNASSGALTATQTLMRPQRGPVFYAPRQALLHFESNLNDDWGNTFNGAGAGLSFTAPCAKFGATGLSVTGSSSLVQSTQIFNPGQSNWTMDVWANLTSNVSKAIFSVGNNFGVAVLTDASGHLTLFLSSGGAAWDIVNGTAGSTVMTAGTFHHVALTYDGSNYRLFLDGVVQVTVASTQIIWPEGVAMTVATQSGSGVGTAGCFDEFDFVPFARWVANFTAPVAAYTVAGDWLDTNKMVMNTATAAGPTWSPIQRLYVAEAATGASSVSAVYNYSPRSSGNRGTSIDNNGLTRVDRHVTFSAASQFISDWGLAGTSGVTTVATVGAPNTWVIPPSVVPPDATYFYIQALAAHAAIGVTTGTSNQDCAFISRLPTGIAQNGANLWTAFSNFSGMGTATNTAAFTEGDGPIVQVPIINGIAAIETIISGTTCAQGSANAAILKEAVVVGYDMP